MADVEVSDSMPSPWVACPRCAGIWVEIVCVLERGDWEDESTYVMRAASEGPKVGAFISGRDNDDSDAPKPIRCPSCNYRFDLADVGFGPGEETNT